MKYLASFRLPEVNKQAQPVSQRCEYVQRIMDMLDFSLKENPKLTTVIPLDLIKYIVLPYISYTVLDFYDIMIDEKPCLYQSFDDEIYEKVPTALKTLEELDTLAKDLYRQFLIRECYLDEDDEIDPALSDRDNLCGRFNYEVGHLIRLTPRYHFVSDNDFEPRTSPLESLTLHYTDDRVFSQHVRHIMQPVYHRVYEEIQTYKKQVSRYLAEYGSVQEHHNIDSLYVKCLTHLRYRPGLNNLMTMIINDPDHLKIVKEEGIELVFYDEYEQ